MQFSRSTRSRRHTPDVANFWPVLCLLCFCSGLALAFAPVAPVGDTTTFDVQEVVYQRVQNRL